MASPNSSGGCESQDEKRHKSRRWRGLIAIAVVSCLFALLVGPLWSLMAHHQSITDDGTTTTDTNSRRTKPNQPQMHFTTDGAGGAIYVWPQRLADADVVVQGTNERHYRRRRDLVWHPHPSYQLTLQDGSSWGRLNLEPAGDDQLFVSGRADVVQLIDEANNVSSSMKPDDWRPLRGCFYRGQVQPPVHQRNEAGAAAPGRDSKVVLSLCHGLTGHIRTSGGSFFIEPSPLTDGNRVDDSQTTTGAVRHVIYRVRHPFRFEQPLQSSPTSRPVRAPRDDSPHHGSGAPTTDEPEEEGEEEVDVGGRRRRRSVSQERFVEILVVADGKMVSYHGDNLVHYILTLMSVVSLIYKDASLGNPVQIAVVRMLLLKDQEFVLTTATGDDSASSSKESHEILDSRPGKSASEMLRNFCKWQRVFNDMDDSSPYHHDTALLLTRENICRNPQLQKCDTLGLAELGTMCDSSNSCSIVQDNGLSAAFTIAHELGHVLNMPHDDDFKCQQFVESTGGVHNVMSRMLDHNTFPWAWSNCSRYFITEYLDGGYGECLLDKPSTDLLDAHRAAKKLPGENFDENKQCELVFGHGSKICPYMPPCKRLWCTTSGGEQEGCRTQHMPWADGTACGRGRWCRHGTCLSRDVKSLEPVDGNWGSWQEWMMGTCSRTCGGGVQRSTRNCDNPAPSNGGTFCLGKRVRYRSCNIQECPAGTPDFREKQCSDFNSNNFNIQGLPADVKWVPKYAGISVKDRCRLYCRVEQSSAYYLLKDKVIDGTSCGPDTDDICVNGICKPASCNHVLGRKEQLDLCGVCGGDNSTCVILNGGYNSTQYGYNTVTRIPAGSSSLDIRQRGYQGSNRDDNYLALMDPQTGEYLLNGNFVVSMFQKTIQFGGTTIEYTGSDAVVERLNSSKPLKKDVVVQVLSVGNLYSPDIWYQYVVSRAEGKSPSYHWKLQEQWSACSKLCHGQQFRKPICVQASGGFQKMPEEYCSASPPPPPTETQPCQTQCILRWRVIHHSECSAHCGMGVRNVTKQCEQETLLPQQQQQQHPSAHTVPVDDRHCRHLNDPPPDTEPCKGTCHSAHWQFHPWSQCSLTCGGGVQTRKAHCVDLNGRVIADSNCPAEERVLRQSCHMESCPRWEVGEWTPCSVTCGVGQAERIVGCRMENGSVVDSTYCAGQDRPASVQQCVEYPCPTEPPTTTSTSTTQATPTTQQPSTTAIFPTSAVPAASLALAGFRPQPMEIHNIDPAINSLDPTDWNPESNDIPRVVAAWRTGTWGQCSSTCDGGYRMRTVVCYDMMASREVDQAHCSDPAPVGVEKCAAHPCAAWIPHNWTSCSVTCGVGVSVRVVECQFLLNNSGAPDEMCSALEKPPTEKSCSAALAVCIGSPISHSVSVEHNHTSKMPQWRTGSWGSCSKTCGAGFKRRQVVCHDELFKDSDGCIPAKRPQDTVHCNTDPCPTWSSGEWSSCSKSCGGGTQTRPVTCRDHLGQTLPDHRCHPAGRPEYSQSCHTDPCPTEPPVPEKTYRWKTAAWTTVGELNSTSTETTLSDARSDTNTTASFTLETSLSSPTKTFDSFDEQTTTDLIPTPTTTAQIVTLTSEVSVAENHTTVTTTPSTTLTTLSTASDPSPHIANTSLYATSITEFISAPVNATTLTSILPTDSEIPANTTLASTSLSTITDATTTYSASSSSTLGSTVSSAELSPSTISTATMEPHRPVTFDWNSFTSPYGSITPSTRHMSTSSSARLFPVSLPHRPTYAYFANYYRFDSPTCSKTCGKGDQYREVYCQEVEGRVRVDETRCPDSSRPRSRRGCNKAACPYSWEVENWSECSHPCGAGIQHRRVTCHRVNAYEWIDPEPVSFGCNSTQRPADLQECSLGNCHALYVWRASAWQPCTASKCGRQGFQKRSLACVNSRTGSRVSRSYCPQEFRPIRKRRCRASPCGYVSCKDVQLRSAAGKDRKTPLADGPYTLIVAGKNMTIYCHLMNTSSPLEYLTLTTGHQDNYAEVYDKTLIRPDSCPYQGARKDSCDCFLNRRSTGTTSFNKIRLNVTSLRVDSHDFTFARLVRGHQMVGYGEAGDCYSTANCPQGRFSINLQGTGLRVSPHTSWAGHGHRSSLWINRLEDNQKIQGKCGGYCGRCSPDPHAGLKLDVV